MIRARTPLEDRNGALQPRERVPALADSGLHVAERGKRDRQSQAWELLLTRSYDEPPTWGQIFDDLDPSVHTELGELYDALPAGAKEEYVRRYGEPSGV